MSAELRVEGRRFVARDGRTVILRGVNVAGDAKVPPFLPITSPQLLDPLVGMGMNVVRLLFTWEAFEPVRGEYDEQYLEGYTQVVHWAWERGLHVIVDIHQDAFSRYNLGGCGEGFPEWAVPPEIARATPSNCAECADWGRRMLRDAGMHESWRQFHAGVRGVRTRYLDMMHRLARHFTGFPGVIGYDMLNEPWGCEKTEIAPLYEDAAARIRSADPTAILFVSPRALTSAGLQTKLPTPRFGNFAYAPHYYDACVIMLGRWLGFPPAIACARMDAKAAEWGVPLFLGEFGAGGDCARARPYLDALYAALDKRLASGTQWVFTPGWTRERKDGWNDEDFSIVDDCGRTRGNFRLRPYPQRFAGLPTQIRVKYRDRRAGVSVAVAWDHDPALGRTEIFAPRHALFGERVTIETSTSDLECRYDDEGMRLVCESSSPGAKRVVIRTP
jgi:endoglycosylceramidase